MMRKLDFPLDVLEKLSSHSFMFITGMLFCFTWQRIDEFFIIPNSLTPLSLFFLSFEQQKVHNKFDSGGGGEKVESEKMCYVV
jgi:hypothetical protein